MIYMINHKQQIEAFKQTLNCKDTVYYGDATYVGETKQGIRHGRGLLEFGDGGFYFGYFKDGIPNGEGLYQFANGESYEGKLSMNVRNGVGTYIYSDGSSYVG